MPGLKNCSNCGTTKILSCMDNYVVTKIRKTCCFFTPCISAKQYRKNSVMLQNSTALFMFSTSSRVIKFQQLILAQQLYLLVMLCNCGKIPMLTQGITVLSSSFSRPLFREERAPVWSYSCQYYLDHYCHLRLSISSRDKYPWSLWEQVLLSLAFAVSYSLHVFNHYRHTQ